MSNPKYYSVFFEQTSKGEVVLMAEMTLPWVLSLNDYINLLGGIQYKVLGRVFTSNNIVGDKIEYLVTKAPYPFVIKEELIENE